MILTKFSMGHIILTILLTIAVVLSHSSGGVILHKDPMRVRPSNKPSKSTKYVKSSEDLNAETTTEVSTEPVVYTLPPLGPYITSRGRFDPYFDATTPRNLSTLVGKTAYLSCRVRNLGNKTVSWIRHRDIHILTVGTYTYTSDQRFQTNHHVLDDDWTLQVKWAQKRDAGLYECQISTQPVRSYFVLLNVIVPIAEVLGGPDLYVDKGSTINLTCTVKYSPEPPAYIFWYHYDDVISYDSSRGGVTVITEKGDVISISYLLIQHADVPDAGRYSCSPSNADVASIVVHVLSAEKPAAMHKGTATILSTSIPGVILILWLALYLINTSVLTESLFNPDNT